MDKSIETVTQELPVAVQGPCVVEGGRVDAVDVAKLHDLQLQAEMREKVRAYWFVVWPESCDMAKLFAILRESGYAIAVSPLHDKDVKDDSLELAKPHYHIIIRFPSARYLEPTRRLVGSWLFDADALTSIGDGMDVSWYVKPVNDYPGALRYLCHLDDPEKHRYPVNEVMSFGFIDLSPLYASSVSDDVDSYCELIAWCRSNPGRTYADLMDAVYDSQDRALMRVLTRYSYTLKGYLQDRGGRKKKQ